MSDARDLRADTALARDPANPARFRGEINEGWKVVYVFGGVTMYTALRAMQEALNRPELPLVTANAIYLAPVPPGPITVDVDEDRASLVVWRDQLALLVNLGDVARPFRLGGDVEVLLSSASVVCDDGAVVVPPDACAIVRTARYTLG